ncbi:MAG: hypothetical protein WCF04_11875 [Candidatus Nanopelagicales bacterium]
MRSGLVYRASFEGTDVAVKIGGGEGDEAAGPGPDLLEQLGQAGVAPELIGADRICEPSHFEGRRCLVTRWVGPSLADVLGMGEQLAPEDIDRLAVGLLNVIEETSRHGVQALQLALEHVLLPAGGPPVLCGWGRAWVQDQPYEGNAGWPEQDLVPEQTAIYLWGLVLAGAVLRSSPSREHTADDRTFLVIDEESRDLLRRRLDERRAQLLGRTLDVNPHRRPTCDEALREWTGAVRREPIVGVSEGEAPAPWRLRVAARAVDSRTFRFGLMGAAGLVGFILGRAFFGVSPLG